MVFNSTFFFAIDWFMQTNQNVFGHLPLFPPPSLKVFCSFRNRYLPILIVEAFLLIQKEDWGRLQLVITYENINMSVSNFLVQVFVVLPVEFLNLEFGTTIKHIYLFTYMPAVLQKINRRTILSLHD